MRAGGDQQCGGLRDSACVSPLEVASGGNVQQRVELRGSASASAKLAVEMHVEAAAWASSNSAASASVNVSLAAVAEAISSSAACATLAMTGLTTDQTKVLLAAIAGAAASAEASSASHSAALARAVVERQDVAVTNTTSFSQLNAKATSHGHTLEEVRRLILALKLTPPTAAKSSQSWCCFGGPDAIADPAPRPAVAPLPTSTPSTPAVPPLPAFSIDAVINAISGAVVNIQASLTVGRLLLTSVRTILQSL